MVLWFTKAMNFLKGLQQESQRGDGNGPWCLFLLLALHLSFGLWVSQQSSLYMFRSYSACIYLTFFFSLYLWTVWTTVLFCLSHIFPFSCTLFHDIWRGGGTGTWDWVWFAFGWTWTGMDLGVQQPVTVVDK